MLTAVQDRPKRSDATFFSETCTMPKRSSGGTGRPRALSLTPDDLQVVADALKDASTYLNDAAKFMRENGLDSVTLPAAKLLDEHLPAVQSFSRKAFAEVGPAATLRRLGRKTKLEANQERYEKYGRGKGESQ